jgi:hypothetical protein
VIIQLHNPQQGYAAYREAWPKIKDLLQAGKKINIEIKPATRSLEQNSRLWAMLGEISEQVDWYGRKLTEEEWKHVFTAALKKQEVVPGLDGGFVVLGQSTRNMTKAEMCDLQTLMEAFGAEKGVRFSA